MKLLKYSFHDPAEVQYHRTVAATNQIQKRIPSANEGEEKRAVWERGGGHLICICKRAVQHTQKKGRWGGRGWYRYFRLKNVFFYRYIYDFLFSYLRQSLILFSFFLFLYRSLSFFIISNRFWIHWYFSNWKYRKILLLLVFWPKNSKVWTVSNHLQFVVILNVVLVLYLLQKICNSETSSSHFHLRNYINFLWFLITGFEFSCFFLLFFHWYFDSKLGSFIYRYKWHLASLRRLQSCLNMSYCKF